MTAFWAKTPKDETPTWENIHTVFHHLIDVGLVFEELLKGAWEGMGDYLTSVFGEGESGFRALCVLAAVHDIGKISPGFQKKVPDLKLRLRDMRFTFHPSDNENHGFMSFRFLIRCFKSCLGPDGSDAALIYAQAASCHHGEYFSIPQDFERISDSKDWERARIEHFQNLCRLWEVNLEGFPVFASVPPAQWTVILAGVISIADWVGSSLDFPLKAGKTDEYVRIRRHQI